MPRSTSTSETIYTGSRTVITNAAGAVTSNLTSSVVLQQKNDTVSQRSLGPKPQAWMPPKGYVCSGQDYGYPIGFISYTSNSGTRTRISGGLRSQIGGPTSLNMTASPSWLSDSVKLDTLLKLKDQKVNVLVSLAEYSKTADLIGSLALDVAKGIKSFKRSIFSSNYKKLRGLGLSSKSSVADLLSDLPKKWSDRWLQYQYGLLPTLADVSGFLELYTEQPRPTSGYAKRRRSTVERVYQLSPQTWYGPATFDWLVQGAITHTAYCRIDYTVTNELSQLANRVGVSDVLEAGWELIPYSFVADWFIPVGDYFSSLTATTGLSFKGGSLTLFSEMITQSTAGNFQPKIGYSQARGVGICKSRRYNMARQVLSSFPAPTLPVTPISEFRNVWVRTANAIALVVSAVYGGKGYR